MQGVVVKLQHVLEWLQSLSGSHWDHSLESVLEVCSLFILWCHLKHYNTLCVLDDEFVSLLQYRFQQDRVPGMISDIYESLVVNTWGTPSSLKRNLTYNFPWIFMVPQNESLLWCKFFNCTSMNFHLKYGTFAPHLCILCNHVPKFIWICKYIHVCSVHYISNWSACNLEVRHFGLFALPNMQWVQKAHAFKRIVVFL